MKFATTEGSVGRREASAAPASSVSACSRAIADATRASWSSRQTRLETV